jgi:hypothetical protein
MGFKELEEKRQAIIDRHTQSMIEINEKLVGQIDNGLKERDLAMKASAGVFDKIKALFELSTAKGLKMDSEQRLELAKLYFGLQQSNIAEIMKDRTEGYKTQLSDINEQITKAKERIAKIEDEVSQVKDSPSQEEALKKELGEAKRGGYKDL